MKIKSISDYQYVKEFESKDSITKCTHAIVRIDGHGFTKFCEHYKFTKPNDKNALDLMNMAAMETMKKFDDILFAYGCSDEFSFYFSPETTLWDRRKDKILSSVVSAFTSFYVFYWKDFFMELNKDFLPNFDSRIIEYPLIENVKDYFCWRQADCHYNNTFNTTFWNLVNKGNKTKDEAFQILKGTTTKERNAILYSKFNINYNNEPDIFKKGTVIYKDEDKKYILTHTNIIDPKYYEKLNFLFKPAKNIRKRGIKYFSQ